ncbi:type IIS restriction enzyme R protein (BCGIB) [Lactococcus cremoris]|uniref:Type IIS restriction enzyme R protein (BCGIB) n=1 Tax=Lactococcus lactis subsp. cremoris TaxID=1359 RepID=A0A166IZV2_LACLC|nr:restriction endonuclease subunit S [Lactococcus cremoris]KZK05281.1 type IIS restriction enzyme R protein (BCGIB) [Lactococcus cremoris]
MQDKLKELEEKYGVDWRNVNLGSLFEFEAIKQAKSQREIPTDNSENGVPYIVQSMFNNMFSRNVNKQYLIEHNEAPVSGNRIVLGVTLPAVSYQPKEFGASQVITAKANWLNQKNGVFIATAISKLMYQFSYGRKPGVQIYKDMEIKMPYQNNEIAFDYINDFVETLEAERLATLEAYLKVTGLNNVALSVKERASLDKLGEADFKKFTINQLFEISTPKKKFNANTISFGGKLPYVARGENNNGIRGYIDEDEKYLNAGNTISFGQDTATMFYQEKPYFTGDKIKIFTAKNSVKFDKKIAWFIISSMRKSFSTFSWGSSSYNVDILNKTEIKLPVKSDGKIDYELMSNLVSAIQKFVIKGVVEWVDKRIELTRGAIKK